MTIYKKIDGHNVATLEVLLPIQRMTRIRLINRIQVPEQFRGKGFGSSMLKIICELADKQEFILFVHVFEKSHRNRILSWLNRHKFIMAYAPNLMCRIPEGDFQPPTIAEITAVKAYLEED